MNLQFNSLDAIQVVLVHEVKCRCAFNEGDMVTFVCLPTIAVAVGKLFEGAPDTTV